MYHPLNSSEVQKVAGGARECRVLTYSELSAEHGSIEEAFGGKKKLIILYVHSDPSEQHTTGHWVGLGFQNPDTLCYIDSYGKRVDEMLKSYSKEHRDRTMQDLPTLTLMMKKWIDAHPARRRVEYNNVPFQSTVDKKVATCGRYAAFRLRYIHVPEDDFEYAVKEASRQLGVTFDELMVRVTDRILRRAGRGRGLNIKNGR